MRALKAARYGTSFTSLDFTDADLVSLAGPRHLWFERCDFADADLRQATLDGWTFKLCDFSGAKLRGASLRGTSFTACDFTGADLRDTDLRNVAFRRLGTGEDAIDTVFDGALGDLSGIEYPTPWGFGF